MKKLRSKRADVLGRALQDINSNTYDEHGRYLVFGTSSIWDMIEDLSQVPEEGEDDSLAVAISALVGRLRSHSGRVEIGSRASLNPPSNFKPDEAFGSLSAGDQRKLELIVNFLQGPQGSVESVTSLPAKELEDLVDAALAEELLGKLAKAVDRAARLEEWTVNSFPNKEVRHYFEEAHRCYLYGFHVACVLMCRAMLEAALEHLCDPKGKLKASTSRESYYSVLIGKARTEHLLVDPKSAWAKEIRTAGNEAAHDFSAFERNWQSKVDEILLKTRKVLLDLYSMPK